MKLPQLHIRDLFWLMLVVAMGCAWWVRERSWSQWRDAAVERVSEYEKFIRAIYLRIDGKDVPPLKNPYKPMPVSP